MKYMIIGLFCILSMSFGFAKEDIKQVDVQLKENGVESSVGDIMLRFCNSDNELDHNRHLKLTGKPGETKQICMIFANRTDKDITLKVNMIDGGFTNDLEPKRACKNENIKEGFGKFIKNNDEIIKVKAHSENKVEKEITYDENFMGSNYGCVTYSIVGAQQMNAGGMSYNVIIRKAGFIDLFVEGKILSLLQFTTQQANGLSNGKLNIIEHEDYLDIYTSVRNGGNIPLTIHGSGIITDILGKELDLGSGTIKLLPKESTDIHLRVEKERWWYFNMIGISPSISWYRTFYNGSMNISYEPEILREGIDKQQYSGSIQLDGSAFLIPWWLVILLTFIAIWCVYKIWQKRRKQHKNNISSIGVTLDKTIPSDEKNMN